MTNQAGRSRSSSGVLAKTSTRSVSRCRKGWLTCKRWRSTATSRSRLRRRPCGGEGFDAEREDVGGIASDADHAWACVRPDDWAERLDHQRVAVRLKLARYSLGI